MMASQARNAFQKVISEGMKRPMHTILGLVSMMQDENLGSEQQIIVSAMTKTSNVLSTLINDVEISAKDSGRFQLEMTSFQLHNLIREAACVAKCLCACKGFGFSIVMDRSLPVNVMGDERRVFQVILHVVVNLLNGNNRRGTVVVRVSSEKLERNDQRWAAWRQNTHDEDAYVRFEITITNCGLESEDSSSMVQLRNESYASDRVYGGLSFSICQRLVQLVHGKIWVIPNSKGFAQQSMELVLRFQLRPSISVAISGSGESSEHPHSNSLFRRLLVLLVDADDVNRIVTRKLLERLGCSVATVPSGLFECLIAIGPAASAFQIILVDLQMPELDGFDVAARIQKFRSRSFPLIIALTASADKDLWEKCLQIGMTGVMRKSIVQQGIASEMQSPFGGKQSCMITHTVSCIAVATSIGSRQFSGLI